MGSSSEQQRLSRRELLRLGGAGLVLAAGSGAVAAFAGAERSRAAPAARQLLATRPVVRRRLAATDTHIQLPGRDPLYSLGFVEVPRNASVRQIVNRYKGKSQVPAPILVVDEGYDLQLTLTNLGLVVRPDLDDSHTVHWHGFRNPIALYDGVPEVSVAVPVGRDLTYLYRLREPGTYMYHCHFEDVEHVQMGMTGIVFIRPVQNRGTATLPAGKYAYNDGDGSTRYQREFTLLFNDVDPRPHDLLEAVQEFIWVTYDPTYFVINGRAYPDTIRRENDPGLPTQPISSLIQANPGNRVLLRMVNLGYQQHAIEVPGIRLKVIGEDATLLRGPGGADLSYRTNVVYIGPGEARDILFTTPAYVPGAYGGADGRGSYNTYFLRSRNAKATTNPGLPGLGGMATEVRVYQSTLPSQRRPNETFS